VSDQEVARLQEQIKTLFKDIDELKSDIKEMKNQLANRFAAVGNIVHLVLNRCYRLDALRRRLRCGDFGMTQKDYQLMNSQHWGV
jgi:uncharacterized coiled-coil DUF342 family protein